MPTTMQIRTRRRRGRKISRRQRKVSRRQSLSRRRSNSRSGGAKGRQPTYGPQTRVGLDSRRADTRASRQESRATKANALQLDDYHHKLANNILSEAIDKSDTSHIEDMFTNPIKFQEYVYQNISPNNRRMVNMKSLIFACLLLLMSDTADARIIRSRIKTPGIDKWLSSDIKPLDTTDQLWSYMQLKWYPDPFAFTGPPYVPPPDYGPPVPLGPPVPPPDDKGV
jgi:hypothetical protein